MSFFDELQAATRIERAWLQDSPMIRDALAGTVTLESYVAFLEQAYHHVKHTVPLLMACGARLPTRLEWLREAVAEYIQEEYGHEEWILNDIRACGGDAEAVRRGSPGMSVELMVNHLYDSIARSNPVALFGMVNVLEGTSTALATQAAGIIQRVLGLPDGAFTYLTSHGSLDVGHMATFRLLMDRLEEQRDRDAVLHSARIVYRLYADMFRSLPQPMAAAA